MTEELSIEVIPSIEMMNALGATKDREEPVVMQLPREHSVIEVEEDILEIGDRPASSKKKSIILIVFAIVFATMAIAAGTGYGIYTNKNHTETETSAAALSFVEDECKEEELPPEREFSEILVPTSFPTADGSTNTSNDDPILSNVNDQRLRRLRAKASGKIKNVPIKVRSLHEANAKCAKKAKSSLGSMSETGSSNNDHVEGPAMSTSMTDLSPSMSLPAGDFLLCRQDPARPGISIDNFESGFAEGEAVFSELSLVEANDQMTKTLKDVTTITSSVGTLAALAFPPAAAVSGALTAITGLISLFTGGVSSNDAFIANGFNQMNRKMDELSLQISQGFLDVRKDVADNELDDLMGYLQSIHNAYQDMVDASLDNTTSDDTREVYAQKYRAVCNHPFFTPNDLFRQFYGFACGDNPNRQCATDGDNTGTCKYGVKKRQYIRDIYEGIADGLSSRFIPFGTWLLKAMVLAQFHFEACLPQDELSCNDPVIDPVRKVTAEEMKNATAEVEFNLNYTLNCTFDKFRDTLSDKNFYQTQVPGMNDCLNMKDSEDGSKDAPPENKNKCMATKTREKLNAEFPTKHWAVVVYNEEGTAPDGRAIVIDQCDRGLDYGCMNNNIQELGGRSFHLMYREKSKGRKNYIVNPLGDVVGVLGGLGLDLPVDRPEDLAVTSEDADVFDGAKLGLAVYGVVDNCIGDPLDPTIDDSSDDPKGHIALLRREHGYIAIRTGNGTPRGADYDPAIFREYDLHYSEIETSNPECNMPAFKLHNCMRPTGVEETASNIIPNDPIGIGDALEGEIDGLDNSNVECAHIYIVA